MFSLRASLRADTTNLLNRARRHRQKVRASEQGKALTADNYGSPRTEGSDDRVRDGTLSRRIFRRYTTSLREDVLAVLEQGRACGCGKTATTCRELLAVEPALWTFVRVEGAGPTNNHIERMLRLAVLWRKKSFGSQSESGCRFVERLLTVVQTLRLRGRGVLAYLCEAIAAHRAGLPAPKLLATG